MTTQQTQTQELRTAAFEAIAEITRLTSEAMIEDSGQCLAPVAAHCRTLRQSLFKLRALSESEVESEEALREGDIKTIATTAASAITAHVTQTSHTPESLGQVSDVIAEIKEKLASSIPASYSEKREEAQAPLVTGITDRMYSVDCSPLVQFDDSQRRVKPVRMSWKSQESVSEFSARDKTQLPEGYYGKDPECPFRPTAAMIRTKVCLVLWDMRFNKDSIMVYYPGLSDTSNDYYWFSLSDLREDIVFKVSQAITDRATELKAQKQV